MYLLCIGSGLFSKFGAYRNAVGVARKHFVNWPELVVSAFLGRGGVFRSRAGGTLSCDGKALLRQLVSLENSWRHWGDVLDVVRFEENSLVIPNYFGRDFRIPLRAVGLPPPSPFLKYYPFDVKGEVVLDIGAYLGETPLMWLYKGARSVIAVEPVPLHFKYLEKNVLGLPVVCLNVALAVQLPKISNHYGSIKYGLLDETSDDLLDTPVMQLTELVEQYRPTVVKLNCEGCEHYVLEQLAELSKLGVKRIAVDFHTFKNYDAYASYKFLEEKLGKSVRVLERTSVNLSGKTIKIIKAYWSL
jgi:FkbM family methyltransferase